MIRPGGAQAGKKKEGGEFASWRSAKDEDLKKLAATYTPEFKIVQFTKVIDAASPALFEACVNARKFKLVTVVKRLPQGGSMGLSLNIGLSGISLGVTSTANPIFAFLRLDFSNALITSISWSDGDLVKENITFECRSVKMKYRPQNNDGSIQSSGQVNIEYVQPLEDPPPR